MNIPKKWPGNLTVRDSLGELCIDGRVTLKCSFSNMWLESTGCKHRNKTFFLSYSDLFLPIHCRCRRLLLHVITLNDTHTHIPGRTPLDEGSAHRRHVYLTTHNIHKRQTSMPPAVFEPAIPASERPQTYALDRAPNGA